MSINITLKSAVFCSADSALLSDYGFDCIPVDTTLLPVGIRRRTSLTTRMAVTAAIHVCARATVDAANLPSVFASVGGEVMVTDTLCKTLQNSDELLSPTQFHNSVHNTTAGYWSIISACHAPTTAIAAADDTFAMGLLESWCQLQNSRGDLLLVCYDEQWPQYLAPPMGKIPLVCALVLSVSDDFLSGTAGIEKPVLGVQASGLSIQLTELMRQAPAAACIPLLQAMQQPEKNSQVILNYQVPIWSTRVILS